MSEPISIQGAPSTYRPYLEAGDKAGNGDGVIDSDKEAKEVLAACTKDCGNLKTYLEAYQFQLALIEEKTVLAVEEKIGDKRPEEQSKSEGFIRFDQELQKTSTLLESNNIGITLRILASDVAKSTLSNKEKRELFKQMLMLVQAINFSYHKSDTLNEIASKITESDLNEIEKTDLLEESLNIARSIDDPYYKAMSLNELVSLMARTKLNNNKVKVLFDETLAIAQSIENQTNRLRVLGKIASAMGNAGLFEDAIKLADSIKCSGFTYREMSLRDISSAMADTGQLKEAMELAQSIKYSYYTSEAIYFIISKMIRAGFLKEALAATRFMEEAYFKSEALCDIALAMAKVGSDENTIYELLKDSIEQVYNIEDAPFALRVSHRVIPPPSSIPDYYTEDGLKLIALHFITSTIVEINLNNDNKSQLFHELLWATSSIYRYKADIVGDIAEVIGKSGLAKHQMKSLFKKLLDITNSKIEVSYWKPIIINKIAYSMTEAGFSKQEIDKLFREGGVEGPGK